MFLLSGVFWGLLVLAFGLAMFFKLVFKTEVPTVKAWISFAVIYLGIVMMSADLRTKILGSDRDYNTLIFQKDELKVTDHDMDYFVIFSKGVVDFSQYKLAKGNVFFEVNAIGGKTTVILPDNIPAKVILNPNLAVAKLPESGIVFPFQKRMYKTPTFQDNGQAIIIKFNISLSLAEIANVK